MEAVLGMPVEELNTFLYSYAKKLPQDKKYKLSMANSIWFKDDVTGGEVTVTADLNTMTWKYE